MTPLIRKKKRESVPTAEQRKLEQVQDEMLRHLEYLAAVVRLQRRQQNPEGVT